MMMSSSVEEKDDQYLTDVLSYSAERLAKVRDDDFIRGVVVVYRCGVAVFFIFRCLSSEKHY